jgi:transcriptional antiterminator RfaH
MSIDPYKLQWYTLYTKSRQEKKIKTELDILKVENYLPLVKTLKKWSDRKKWIEEPVFKSYIFIKTNGRKYFDILNIDGVSGFVKFNGEPAIISDKQMKYIKQILEADEEVEVNTENLRLWQKVRIKRGPFMGIEGLLHEIKGNKKVVIQLENIGHNLLIDVKANDIEVLEF